MALWSQKVYPETTFATSPRPQVQRFEIQVSSPAEIRDIGLTNQSILLLKLKRGDEQTEKIIINDVEARNVMLF